MTSIILIAAMDRNRGIGIDNKIPWHITEDFRHFKRTTILSTIVMGRSTFESIGKPLPNRNNIVLTRNPNWKYEGVSTFESIEECLKDLKDQEQVYVIGGAEIYKEFLPLADKMILTEINASFHCDTFFPDFDKELWKEVRREPQLNDEFDFSFVRYERQ